MLNIFNMRNTESDETFVVIALAETKEEAESLAVQQYPETTRQQWETTDMGIAALSGVVAIVRR